MAPTKPRPGGLNASSGQRSKFRYIYGLHFWIPEIQAGWSKGMVRDTARDAIPSGSVYDAVDFLLHKPGVAQKRGGTTYAGPAMTGATYATGAIEANFPAGRKLVVMGDNTHGFTVTSGTTTDLGVTGIARSKPAFWIGGTKSFLIWPDPGGTNAPYAWDGSAAPAQLTGSPPLGRQAAVYKARLVLGGTNASPQRLFFSPVPDITTTWDTANSWIDCDHPVTGLAALNTALLIFSVDGMERIIGATPPPNSDMDRAPVSPIGCTDSRSIVTVGPNVYFANPEGIYMTNGSTPISLTEQGGIATYWRSLFTGYVTAAYGASSSTWTIAAGFFRGFLFISVLDASRVVQSVLMCNVANRAWWRVTNMNATAWATAVDSTEFYYADGSTNRLVAMSGIFSPGSANKSDANGTAVTPTIEFAPFGSGPGVKSYGFGRLDYDLRDAASDNPALVVTNKGGIEADVSWTPVESPLAETTTLARKRFQLCRDMQTLTVNVTQTNASAKTELYALEVENRPQSMVGDGVS